MGNLSIPYACRSCLMSAVSDESDQSAVIPRWKARSFVCSVNICLHRARLDIGLLTGTLRKCCQWTKLEERVPVLHAANSFSAFASVPSSDCNSMSHAFPICIVLTRSPSFVPLPTILSVPTFLQIPAGSGGSTSLAGPFSFQVDHAAEFGIVITAE